jgi:hypothetical protein
MRAMLKDHATGDCAPDYVFDIEEVLAEKGGEVLWLRLAVPPAGPGTEVEDIKLPALNEIGVGPGKAPTRSPVSVSQFEAACELAAEIQSERTTRLAAMKELVGVHGMKNGSASSLLNNYRCMVAGKRFVAPMSADAVRHFADRIIAAGGTASINAVVAALKGYVEYSQSKLKNPAYEIAAIVQDLERDLVVGRAVEAVIEPLGVDLAEGGAKCLVTQVLREVWVRGSAHAAFKRELERRWKDRCSVHGAACNGQLRASHIVAWRLDEALRGDVNNGLLLSVPLDSLFDAGLITFSKDGCLMKSAALEDKTLELFGVRPGLRLAWDHLREQSRGAIRENLTRHKRHHTEMHPYQVF